MKARPQERILRPSFFGVIPPPNASPMKTLPLLLRALCLPASLLCLLPMGALSAAEPAVRWICSTPGQPWTPMEITAGAPADKTPVLEVDPGTTYQVMDGFGGCFNDLGWQALLALPVLEREAALKALGRES